MRFIRKPLGMALLAVGGLLVATGAVAVLVLGGGDAGDGLTPSQLVAQAREKATTPGGLAPVFSPYTGTGASSSERVEVMFHPGRMQKLLAIDAIRPIYEPTFVPASQSHLDDRDHVLGVSINGDARAYPVATLNFREMVNDVVGGVPVLVTW